MTAPGDQSVTPHARLSGVRETLPEVYRAELLDGLVVVSPVPTPEHQMVLLDLARWLGRWARSSGSARVVMGPVDHRLAPDEDEVLPDVVLLRHDNPRARVVPTTGARGGWIAGPPDLLVEVLDGSSERLDLGLRRERYAARGVPHLWLVDWRTRTARCLSEPQTLDGEPGYATERRVPWDELVVPWAPEERWGDAGLYGPPRRWEDELTLPNSESG